jgi:putative ABC transport system permease protein
LIEAVVVGLAGAAAALVVTSLAFDFLLRQVPPAALGQAPVGVGWRVIGFALGLGVAAGLAFAVVPAWRASRLDAQVLIRGTGHAGGRRDAVGRPMLAAQVGFAVVLVFGAVIAARAFVSVLQVPLGFDPDNVITVTVNPPTPAPDARRGDGASYLRDFYARAVEAIQARADVVAAGAVGTLPFDSGTAEEAVVSADTGESSMAGVFHVFPGYFETAGIELVRGRLPTWDDLRAGAGVAVVPESTARLLFGDQDPIGRAIGGSAGGRFTIVGVVGEVTQSIGGRDRPPAYVIPGEEFFGIQTLVARTRSRSEATLADIRRQIGAMAPGVPVTARWWSDSISSVTAYRNPRFQTLVLGSFASLALGLTGLGVFGLVAFLVASRRREMGIRMAIGATPRSLVRLMLANALAPTLIGTSLGLLATRWLSRLAEAQLYDVDTRDPATLAAAVIAVTLAALLAAYLPARQAARIDPMTVLRRD